MGEHRLRHRWLAAALGAAGGLVIAGTVPPAAGLSVAGPAGGRPGAAPVPVAAVVAAAARAGFAAADPARAGFPAAASPARPPAASGPGAGCSAAFFHGDRRLGPARLGTSGELGRILRGYRRLGGLPARAFLARFWDPAARAGKGGWRPAPHPGLPGPAGRQRRIEVRLTPGRWLDRFGPPGGTVLSPYGTPFARRSLPPASLAGRPPVACNYYAYRVARAFSVEARRAARWFRQPGGGFRYHLSGRLLPHGPAGITVSWLVTHGYLRPLAP
jgi:hypothetical protein